jgi:hypothetical protein
LADDVKQHITTLVGRLNNCNLPLVLEFDVTEEGVEFASLHSSFVCFAIDVSSSEIHGLMYQPPPGQDEIRSIMPHGRGFRISC